jgi:hypothetical protein
MKQIQLAIVHAGDAHRDEFFALGLAHAAGILASDASIVRRDPTAEELGNPEILVLDVGGQHQPELSNFDHHQLPRGTEECAFSLLAKHLTVPGMGISFYELFSDRPWYKATVILDSRGPFELAKREGLSKLPASLWSPVESASLKVFEKDCDTGFSIACVVMEELVRGSKKAREEIETIAKIVSSTYVSGLMVLRIPSKDTEYAEDYLRKAQLDPAVLVFDDNRGAGLCLFRRNDNPKVDFSILEGDASVAFAHKGGFIAKTRSASDDWMGLVRKSLK